MKDYIVIRGARLHNLKNITLRIPRNKFVVFTGLSGSGKSTLVFDTIHQEGQRQYLESLGMVDYAQKPNVDRVEGLSPSISVDQHLTNRSPRSTVGTATEVYTYLRVLYARLGVRPCPACYREIPPAYDIGGASWEDESAAGDDGDEETLPCPHCGTPVPVFGMAHFSFNKPVGACPTCTGLGEVYDANLKRLLDPDRSVLDNGVLRWDQYEIAHHSKTMQAAGQWFGFDFDPATPIGALGEVPYDLLLYGVHHPRFHRHFPDVEPPETVAKGRFEGVVTNLLRRHEEHANDAGYREKIGRFLIKQSCPDCAGTRLRAESRAFTIAGQSIVDSARMPLTDLAQWLEQVAAGAPPRAQGIVEPIITDLRERVRRLIEVGVGYLTLERASPTLSAGEAQRLRLAMLLGSGLTGVLYVLDEPTIGLHQRDTARLIGVLRRLRDLGNTVLVVEHDLELIRAADYVVDIGPGAGRQGGYIVATGTPDEIGHAPGSITGEYLMKPSSGGAAARRRGNGKHLRIRGAREHNLKNITVSIPLGTLTVVTGVSGSGKSSLMLDIFDRAARQRFNGASVLPGEYDTIEGWEYLDEIITIDQTAIGRTSRSNAATYTDVFTAIRQAFAATDDARRRSLTARHFSFNAPGGRCERCQGTGALTINMHFLPDVEVRCPACKGRRFKPEILEVKYRGHDITEVLNMTIQDALPLFEDVPAAAGRLSMMVEVGLGYLQLGQPATTLSGGEAQRIKLTKELGRRATGRTLYLLDEPSAGLHPADVLRLLAVFHRLVETGNTVVVIEHDMDIIRAADWIIDLGPEGGGAGGRLIAEGTPEEIAQVEQSYTGLFLKSDAGG